MSYRLIRAVQNNPVSTSSGAKSPMPGLKSWIVGWLSEPAKTSSHMAAKAPWCFLPSTPTYTPFMKRKSTL
jgi:hypothetical protein